MLWSLDDQMAGQYFRCWSTCVKLVWNVPRATHTYFVDNLLATNFESTRQQVLSRYVKFVRGLLSSPSTEVALMANIVAHDLGSTTGRNMSIVRRETGLNPWAVTPAQIRDQIPKSVIPKQDHWRLDLLSKYLAKRASMENDLLDTKEITGLINSLCIN